MASIRNGVTFIHHSREENGGVVKAQVMMRIPVRIMDKIDKSTFDELGSILDSTVAKLNEEYTEHLVHKGIIEGEGD